MHKMFSLMLHTLLQCPFDVVIDVSSLLPSSSGSTQTFSLLIDIVSGSGAGTNFQIESKEEAGSSGATLSTARQ